MFGRRDFDLENFFPSFLSSYIYIYIYNPEVKHGSPENRGPLENPGDSELGVPIMASGEPC